MWDDRYGEPDFAYGTKSNDFLAESWPGLGLAQGSKVLMLAEGEGRNAVFLAEEGMNVTGVDLSAVGLEKAKQLASERGVSIVTIQADLAEFDMGSEQWDAIVGIFCHLPPPLREKVLGAIPEALKPDGCFVLECYTPAQIEYKTGGPPNAALMYSKDILAAAFEGKLNMERNEELIRDVVEGKYHTGKAAVVQFIGRKPTK
jgi:SAM-dependent methyltransferase